MKHQVYRYRDQEVIIEGEKAVHRTSDEDHRVQLWLVRAVLREGGKIVVGPLFEAPANELSSIGRTIQLKEEQAA